MELSVYILLQLPCKLILLPAFDLIRPPGDLTLHPCGESPAMAEIPLASIHDFIQFADPAYTYVLRLPLPDYSDYEKALQNALCSDYPDLLDNIEMFATMPGPDSPRAQLDFLERYGPEKSFCVELAHSAHMAAFNMFSSKQGKAPPIASIFSQCELGKKNIHVHLVIAGDGLNRYSAKSTSYILGHKWADNIIAILEDRICKNRLANTTFALSLINNLKEAKRHCQPGNSGDLCTVLQYKSRGGGLYACRIDGREFICNYLLPKNLRYFSCVDPSKATPAAAHFPLSSKTYGISFMNGKLVPLNTRRQWWNDLKDKVLVKDEPVFSGEVFGDLPKVTRSSWNIANHSELSGGQPHVNTKMNKKEGLILDCLRRCEDNLWLTYEDLVAGCADLLLMLESMPGGSKLIETVLNMLHVRITQNHSAYSYLQVRFNFRELTSDRSTLCANKCWKLLLKQGYNPWMAGHWTLCVLSKRAGKQNTINFFGPASTGKTNMAKAIVNAVRLYGCVNHQNKNFIFNDCAAKLIVWWEECVMHNDWVEQAKCILGGTEFRIDRKHRESHLLPQTPVVISTNNNIYQVVGGNSITHVHEAPLRDRVVQFNFMQRLESTFGEITPTEVAQWLAFCSSRFDISLLGFHAQWNLQKTPNDFPLTPFCSGHSQDLTLYEHGVCDACGGYYPLETRDRGDVEDAIAGTSSFNIPSNSDFSHYIDQFDLTLLNSPETPETTPSTSTDGSSAPDAPKKQVRKRRHCAKRLFTSVWDSQPNDDVEWRMLEGREEKTPRQESDAESSAEQEGSMELELSPTQWGEMLGLVAGDIESGEPPITLHCFESLTDEDWDSL